MQIRNAQGEMDALIRRLGTAGVRPRLLLHVCCAPCSSHVLEYLGTHFDITLYYYNPNIAPAAEYERRFDELRSLIARLPEAAGCTVLAAPYEPAAFASAVRGLENEPEGGARCHICYELRLTHTARAAQTGGFDYFTTTLSISPYKNAALLNEIGQQLDHADGPRYLWADFKKKGGYQRSIALSRLYGLYRQDYCGCAFSQREAQARRAVHQTQEDRNAP